MYSIQSWARAAPSGSACHKAVHIFVGPCKELGNISQLVHVFRRSEIISVFCLESGLFIGIFKKVFSVNHAVCISGKGKENLLIIPVTHYPEDGKNIIVIDFIFIPFRSRL